MRKLFYILLMLLFAKNVFSQVIDTCFVNETGIYHAKNQQQNSLLYWEVIGGIIKSENPSKTDSLVILWNTTGICELRVYEETDENCIGELVNTEILIIEKESRDDSKIILSISNVFTPNGDGKNDVFEIKSNSQPKSFLLVMKNRWGRKVFESDDINNSWNGKINNEDCSVGVYFYTIQFLNQEIIEHKNGFVYLYR